MMIMKKGKKERVLDKEPYLTFHKKFMKLDSITNEKIHMRIASGSGNKKNTFVDGFQLDYAYTKWFDLEFRFASFIEDERKQNQKFCIFHTISYRFEDTYYQDMMMDTIADIQKRDGYFYISSLVQECKVHCSVNDKNVVTVSFSVCCEKNDAKEVCLQLINQDIALFARGF